MMQVPGLSTRLTDSLAASSGRQRNVTSDSLIRRLRSARSLRLSESILSRVDVGALGEVFVDLQAGGAFLAVDKDFVGHLGSGIVALFGKRILAENRDNFSISRAPNKRRASSPPPARQAPDRRPWQAR
jgi:hypothetical protein